MLSHLPPLLHSIDKRKKRKKKKRNRTLITKSVRQRPVAPLQRATCTHNPQLHTSCSKETTLLWKKKKKKKILGGGSSPIDPANTKHEQIEWFALGPVTYNIFLKRNPCSLTLLPLFSHIHYLFPSGHYTYSNILAPFVTFYHNLLHRFNLFSPQLDRTFLLIPGKRWRY